MKIKPDNAFWYDILIKEQFGFRCTNSTEIAIYTLINRILSSLNNKIIVGGLFCDLQKAFNWVNYNILLSKMKFYGISGVANKLMESYLRNRYQIVVINVHNNSNGHFSKWEEVQHRIPQGSVLGSLLFLIYVNDLSKSVSDNSSPFLLLMTQASLLQIEMRLNLNLILTRYLMK